MILFGDSFSSEDELLSEFIDNNLEVGNVPEKNLASSSTQLGSVSSLAPTNEVTASTVDENRADSSGGKETCQSASEIGKKSIQSPQSVVLERLRENLLCSEGQCGGSGSSENSSQNMPPQKGPSKAGAASGLKQTDIGVFFGLKPLKEKEAEKRLVDLGTSIPTAEDNSTETGQRRDRQRKTKAGTAADTSQATETVNDLSSASGRGEGGRGGTRGWRRRWNRGNADGEVALPRCPFYKKIPGQ